MLCFLFAALIVALDQFLKRWVLRTLDVGEIGPEIIPGVLGLTRWENDGAMLNILSGQQWLLAGIAFVAAVVLVMILLRYNEGFWGTIGLAAVLGGTIGNLIDRIFNDGRVVDMFRTLFINFPIFNIADVFITLGFITFLIHFIALSISSDKREHASSEYDEEYYDQQEEGVYDEFPEIDGIVSAQAENEVAEPNMRYSQAPQYTRQQGYATQQDYSNDNYASQQDYLHEDQFDDSLSNLNYSTDQVTQTSDDYEAYADATTDTSFSLDALEAELSSLDDYGDYNVDDLLREYGFSDDDNV